jgi:hypothetical protein
MLSVFFAWFTALVLYVLAWHADFWFSPVGYVLAGWFAVAGAINAWHKSRD